MKIKEELKTLKDIEVEYLEERKWGNDPQTAEEFGWVKIDELKAEAIKRAKQCVRNIKDKHYKTFNQGRLWEIMDFNNLSEEDLEEK